MISLLLSCQQLGASHKSKILLFEPGSAPNMGVKIVDHKGEPVEHGRKRLSTGVRIHYYTAGKGPALLLEHGVWVTLSTDRSN